MLPDSLYYADHFSLILEDMARWQKEESLGGELASHPFVVSLGNNMIHTFYKGTDKALWHRAFIHNRWQKEESLGGELASHPFVVSLGNNMIHTFYKGTDKALWHRAFI
jgi:hypothetical protein